MNTRNQLFSAVTAVLLSVPLPGLAQISTEPVNPIPVDNSLALLLLSVAFAAAAYLVLRRREHRAALMSVLCLGLVAGVLWQSPLLRAQLLLSFTDPNGESLSIPVTQIGDIDGFEVADYTNNSGARLRISGLDLPDFDQCFPAGAANLQPPGSPDPTPPPTCGLGRILSKGATCRVDVDAVCRARAAENQPPVANDDAFATDEDTPLNQAAPGVLANDSDDDSDPLTAVLVSGPTNAQTFTLNADGSFDYTPTADFNGSDSFTYVANDGLVDSPPATVTLTVNPVNDAPGFTIPADASVLEDAGPQSLAGFATGILAGPPDESGQGLTFNITNNDNPALFSTQPALASDGTLSFTAADDANGTANITVELMDDGGTANGGEDTSAPQTFAINVTSVNNAPSFTGGPDQTLLEDAGPQTAANWATSISAGPTDESGQVLIFNVTANDNPGLFAAVPAIDPGSGDLTFTPAADANGTANITIELMDDGGTAGGGADTSAPFSFVIEVTPVNDAPEFTLGTGPTVLEDAGAQTLPGFASGISAGPTDESGQALTFNIVGNDNASLFSAEPALDPVSGDLTFTPAADANGTANITIELVDDGGTADGGVDASPTQSFAINVAAVNDPPSFTAAAAPAAADEDSGAQSLAWASGISAGPADEAGQALSFILSQTSIDSTLSFTTPPSVNTATGNVEYQAAADAYGTVSFEVMLMDNGGIANGGMDSFGPVVLNITVNPVNDPPTVSAAPSLSVTTNTSLDVAAASGLLANASDNPTEAADPSGPAAPGTTLTVGNGGNPPPTTSALGGDVDIDPTTGAFTYNPPPGLDTGTDSFDFVVCDSGIPGPGACSTPVTATISLSGNTVWYIDNDAAVAGDGRLTTPFNSLGAFNAQQGNGGTGDPAAGDFVFLASSATAYSDGANGITLLNDQTLFGQGTTGTTFDAFTGIAPSANSAPRPVLGGARPVLTSTNHGVSLNTGAANSNTLRGFNLGNTTDNGLNGVVAGTLNVSEVDITGNGALLNLDGGGTGVLNATFGALSSTNSPAPFAFNVIDFDSGSLSAASTAVTTPVAGAFQMTNNSTAAFDFGDLDDVVTTNGAGFIVSGTASVTISPTAPVTVQTVGGPALDLANSAFNGFNFSNVSADNTVTGVRLSNISGAISSVGGTIQNTTGDAFVITGGGDSVTYGGTITNAAGRSVVVTGHSGGNVIFNNSISDSSQGIFLDNNAGTSFLFSGTLTLNTGTNNAFTATNGGNLEATGTGSTITTTTGVGVTISSATIGATGFTTQSVSVNGAPNGIVLINTGNSGGNFVVTGDGTLVRNGSGGTIQNTTDDGVFLNNANNVVLQQMAILNVGNTANPADIANTSNDHAVESRGGGDITLSAVHIQDPIGTGWEAFDITGDNRIDNNSLVEELDRTSNFNGLRVTNTNVNFGSVNIIDSMFDHADPTPGDAANNGNAMVVVSTRGTAGGTFNVDNSTFIGARGTAITVNSGDAAGSSGTLTSNIMNSTFETAHPINGQNNIGMQAIQATTHNKLVDGNTLRDVGRGGSLSGQIIMQKSDTAIMDAEANGNVISEVLAQHGLDALSLSTSTGGRVDWEADANTIFNVGRRGIFNSARGSEPDMDVAISNNTVGRDTGGLVDPVGFDTQAKRGVEIDVQTDAFLQGIVTNNEVIADTDGSVLGGLASTVMFVNVEEFPTAGSATAHVTFDSNIFTNSGDSGSPNVLARTRDAGLTKALDFNATVADGVSSTVRLEEVTGSTVTVEDLATVGADNPGVGTFNIDAGITDHGGNVPEPDF